VVFLEPETKQRPQDEEQNGGSSDANNQMSCPRIGVKRMRGMAVMPSERTDNHFIDHQSAQTKQKAIAMLTAPFIAVSVITLPSGKVGLVDWNLSVRAHIISISIFGSTRESFS
jgi:hypothetical protein